jgi:acetylornithine deacetylase/succinyl-diaminopimelate desuccinylase-like protein
MSVEILRVAERFIATPSVSRDGNLAVAELACELLREVGLEPRLERETAGGVEHANVVADVGSARGDGGLLLVTHLDTVPPGDPARWTATGGDPFRPTCDGDRLYGLGSADVKTDFVCKVAALARVDRARLRRPLRIVGTFGEEIGLLGARALVASGGTRGFGAALVGEPSELAAIVAHKGYAVFEATLPAAAATSGPAVRVREVFDGVSAHSSTPHLGKNAIERALERACAPDVLGIVSIEGGEAVNQVPDRCVVELCVRRSGAATPDCVAYPRAPLAAFLATWRAFQSSLAAPRDARFDPDRTVASLGRARMQGGRPAFSFDVRPIPGVDPAAVTAPLEEIAELACARRNPALESHGETPLARAVADAQRALGLAVRSGTKATCTEAGVLAAAGLDALVIGPGVSVGNIHRPNEHTRISEALLAADLYARVIESLCAKEAR